MDDWGSHNKSDDLKYNLHQTKMSIMSITPIANKWGRIEEFTINNLMWLKYKIIVTTFFTCAIVVRQNPIFIKWLFRAN